MKLSLTKQINVNNWNHWENIQEGTPVRDEHQCYKADCDHAAKSCDDKFRDSYVVELPKQVDLLESVAMSN